MAQPSFPPSPSATRKSVIVDSVLPNATHRAAKLLPAALLLALIPALALSQAITINTSSNTAGVGIDRRYAQIDPTHVDLPQQQIDARGHQEILRILTAEQGFAMRPLPRGKKGLSLAANGKLTPAGESYLKLVTDQGVSVKPGDRVVLSNIRIEKDHIVFDLNGGPDRKHEFLRHVQVGVGGPSTSPVVQDPGQEPTGSRLTLSFSKYVPDLTPVQLKALLAPLISFDVKTPVQAYTDTLPPRLKQAILDHHVMVGMNIEMVLYALGQPESKSREVDGQTPFEEWIYGHPPQDVNFVRVNGNRVIRVELAKLGQPLQVFTQDEVSGLLTTDGRGGRSVLADATASHDRKVPLGDVHRDPDTQSAAAPPSLRAPGEKLPIDQDPSQDPRARQGVMKPVIFPKDTSNDAARTTNVGPHPKPAPPVDEDSDTPATQATPATAQPDAKPTSGATASASPKTPSPSN